MSDWRSRIYGDAFNGGFAAPMDDLDILRARARIWAYGRKPQIVNFNAIAPDQQESAPPDAYPTQDWRGIGTDNNRALQDMIDRNNQAYSGTDPDTLQRVAPQHDRRTDMPLRPPSIPGSSAPPQLAEWPVPGYGKLNQADKPKEGRPEFGMPRGSSTHGGIDIQAPEGTPVIAAADGTIVGVHQNPKSEYGYQVIIDHGGYRYTQSAHLGSAVVKPGDKVKAGQVVGTVGRTGNVPTQGDSHVHYEVRDGSPEPRIANKGTVLSDPLWSLPKPYIPRR